MATLYHITHREDWERALEEGVYRADTLSSQGFIHCSTYTQVQAVATRYYRGQIGLVLLQIDSRKVQPMVRFENLEGGTELYPHIYGPLNLDAVEKIIELVPGPDGLFTFFAEQAFPPGQ